MITACHPSRGRPQLAFQTYQSWMAKAVDKNIQWILSLDVDDKTAFYRNFFKDELEIIVNYNKNLVDAVNVAIPLIEGDLVIVVSDDFDCPDRWDESLKYYMAAYYSDAAVMLKDENLFAIYINDGYSFGKNLFTLPILSKSLIDKLGYIYYPAYTGMWADNDLYEVCEKLGVIITKDILFQHKHYTNKMARMDATYQRHNNQLSWAIGERLIKGRRQVNFNLDNFGKPKSILSIQIPTVIERKEQFEKLYEKILKQAEGKSVEVIYEQDNKEISVGAKRQKLLMRSHADYFVQIDDDDDIADNYVDKVLEALKSKPDCVGYLESILWDGKQKVACHSKRYYQWMDNPPNYDYARTPFFKDVIRVDLAQRIGINDLRFGEDHDFAKRIKPYLQSEVFIDEMMYFYTYQSQTAEQSNKRYGIS